ncbi:MAG TPA: radical SAM protein [Methanosarcina sp.]|jgi:radical SAM protein with 4Fe4S-binding SPASM domain
MNSSKYIPEVCVWELTLKCNMKCKHCGSMAGKARENELTVDECLDVAEQLVNLGCKKVTFIGGEVFLYRGWKTIARKLSDNGLDVNIITNGFLLGDEQIAQIKYAKLTNVGISLDGMENNHNTMRNVSNSFEKVMKSFEILNKEGISLAVVTSLVDSNFGDLWPMYDLLVEKDVKIWQIQIVTPMGNMAGKKDGLLEPAKVPLITRFIREKRNEQKIRIYAGDDIGYFDENELYLRNRPGVICAWSGCQAGLRAVGIDSVGNIKGCESLYSDEFIEGNLRAESLSEIWCKEGNFAYNRNFDVSMLTGSCKDCDKGAICRGGCRGACYFTTDSKFENPYCCYPGKSMLMFSAK